MRILYAGSLLSITFLAFLFCSSMRKSAPQSPQPDIVAIDALRNPDRGYHLESTYFAQNLTNPFATEVYPKGFVEAREKKYQCEKDSLTLTQLYIYLSQWVSQDILQQGLDNIQSLFDGLRSRGYKAI